MKFGILLGITGLLMDIIGAWFISRGLVKKNIEDIRQESGFSFAVNEAYLISGMTQKIEATVGFVLLTSGFMFQICVYALNEYYSIIIWNGYATISIIGLFGSLILSNIIISRKVIAVRKIILLEQLHRNGHPHDKPMHIEDTRRYLRYLKIKHDAEIGIEEAWPLLLKNLGMIS